MTEESPYDDYVKLMTTLDILRDIRSTWEGHRQRLAKELRNTSSGDITVYYPLKHEYNHYADNIKNLDRRLEEAGLEL